MTAALSFDLARHAVGSTSVSPCPELPPKPAPGPRWAAVTVGTLSLLLLFAALIDAQIPNNAPLKVVPRTLSDAPLDARPSAAAPMVEPLVFLDIDAETARSINAATPFASLGSDRPAPLHLAYQGTDFERAADCLASAVLYEAGDDREGQAAVAQVVLNRVRHPAFPHSVCGVVFQGSERSTGCQFTFTCDGALNRPPSPGAWQRARATATAFLQGETDPRVGMATHYHTDWVHPYWSGTLDKIARVGTHLFFRWKDGWGRKASFAAAYARSEPVVPLLSSLSLAHQAPTSGKPALAEATGATTITPSHNAAEMLAAREGDHFILVDAVGDGGKLALEGLGQCSGQPYCKIVGWDRRAQAYGSPANPLIRSVAFLYVSDKRTGVEVVLWDCIRYNRPSQSQCLSNANRRWISFQGDLSRVS